MEKLRFFGFFGGRQKKNEQLVWGPIRNDEQELRNRIDAFPKGNIAIDGTLAADGTFYVFEIQGLNAGITGLRDMEKGRVRDSLRRAARQWEKHSDKKYSNPRWFVFLTMNKAEQAKVIPPENRPETVSSGRFDDLFRRGKVIVKPVNGAMGQGIRIFDADHIQDAHHYANKLSKVHGGFVAQTYIESAGADAAPESIRGHAASIRLIVPFKKVNGKIVPTMQKFGYQRVARYAPSEVGTEIRGKRIKIEDTGVVNLSRDAAAAPMSDREYAIALPIALRIIENLSLYGKTTGEYQEVIERNLREVIGKINYDVARTYNARIEHDSYPRHGKLGKEALFMRQIERQLATVDSKVWKSSIMKRRNRNPEISRGSDELQARIKLKDKKRKTNRYDFSLDDPGSLNRLLQNFVEENRTRF